MKIERTTIIYILLFIFCLNLFNLEGRWLVLSFFALLILQKSKGKIILTKTSFVLGCFCGVFYLLSAMYDLSSVTFYILPYLLGPFLGYTIGLGIMKMSNPQTLDKHFKNLIYVIAFGRFSHGLLNYLVSGGYVGGRNGIDFWTNSILSATLQGGFMTLSISLLFYALFCVSKYHLLEKIILLGAVSLSILNNIQSASRTALVAMILVFVACVLYTLYTSGVSKGKKFMMLFGVLLFVVLGGIAFQQNWFGLQTRWQLSAMYDRIHNYEDFQTSDMGRKEKIASAIASGLHHPFGEGSLGNAHNLWFDTLVQTGWIPFFLLCLFFVQISINCWKFIRRRSIPMNLRYLLLSVFLACVLNFSVEPVMQGMPYFFAAFCMIMGAVEQYLRMIERNSLLESESNAAR